jgi:hypothetical protein
VELLLDGFDPARATSRHSACLSDFLGGFSERGFLAAIATTRPCDFRVSLSGSLSAGRVGAAVLCARLGPESATTNLCSVGSAHAQARISHPAAESDANVFCSVRANRCWPEASIGGVAHRQHQVEITT